MICSSAGRQNLLVGIRENNPRRAEIGQAEFLTEWGLISDIRRGVEHFWRKRGMTPPPVSQTRIDFNPNLNER